MKTSAITTTTKKGAKLSRQSSSIKLAKRSEKEEGKV
jgi:hypothetical protein